MSAGVVKRRATNHEGITIGRYDENPLLNSMIYEIEFPDGQIKEYAANVLSDNLLSQVDSKGFSSTLLEGIVDFKKDESAVCMTDRCIVTKRGQRKL